MRLRIPTGFLETLSETTRVRSSLRIGDVDDPYAGWPTQRTRTTRHLLVLDAHRCWASEPCGETVPHVAAYQNHCSHSSTSWRDHLSHQPECRFLRSLLRHTRDREVPPTPYRYEAEPEAERGACERRPSGRNVEYVPPHDDYRPSQRGDRI